MEKTEKRAATKKMNCPLRGEGSEGGCRTSSIAKTPSKQVRENKEGDGKKAIAGTKKKKKGWENGLLKK